MWSEIIGHKNQIDQLKEIALSGRLHNAYIFFGPEGVGKSLVAKKFISTFACESQEKPCGRCNGCDKIKKGIHPDLIEIDITNSDAKSISIDDMRKLNHDLRFHPMEMKRKFAIINNAEKLTMQASNSILKLLEEPPPNTHIILTTSLLQSIIPTIRSRSQKLPFSLLSSYEITKLLVSNGYETSIAEKLSRISDGSIGNALKIPVERIDNVVEKLNSYSKNASAADLLELADDWANDENQLIICDICLSWYKEMIKISLDPDYNSVLRIDYTLSTEDALKRTEKLIHTRNSLNLSGSNKLLLFEDLLFSLFNPKL